MLLFFLPIYYLLNKSEESKIINTGQALFNIITNSGKLCFTRICILVCKDENTKKQNISEIQKLLLEIDEFIDMLLKKSFKQHAKRDFELQIESL